MARHLDYGKEAEKAACRYLKNEGYQVLAQNYRHGRAEIDLIATHGSTLVFVEVKARSATRYGYPEEAVNLRKQDLLQQAAIHYIEDTGWQGESRFDVISISGTGPGQQLHHIVDAFF